MAMFTIGNSRLKIAFESMKRGFILYFNNHLLMILNSKSLISKSFISVIYL